MKKGEYIVLFLFLFLIVLLLPFIVANSITGEVITGDATLDSVGMNITINPSLPTLTIFKPKNNTYFSNSSFALEFSSNADNSWYNLDNGSDISFNGSTTLDVSEGHHFLSIFVNNSEGIVNENISFYVNLSLYSIVYDEYKGGNKGSSTNFDYYSFEEVQELENTVLENTKFGKISFNEEINITSDINYSDYITNLDLNTNISFNRIEITNQGHGNRKSKTVSRTIIRLDEKYGRASGDRRGRYSVDHDHTASDHDTGSFIVV